MIGGDRLLDDGSGVLALDVLQLFLKLGNAAIRQLTRALVLAAPLGVGEFDPQRVELGL